MAEYIEREKAVEKITAYCELRQAICENNRDEFLRGLQTALKAISCNDVILASDVQPIKRGHWYHNTSKYVSELDAYFIQARCSCCCRYNDRIDQYSQVMSNEYCSYCGADMRDVDAGEIAKE